MNFRFHPQALREFEDAVVYYEERQTGLGARFSASIQAAIEGAVSAPEMWPVFEASIRRRLARVFPYAVLYSVLPERAIGIGDNENAGAGGAAVSQQVWPHARRRKFGICSSVRQLHLT